MFSVYVLISESCGKTYAGQTKDRTARLDTHNSGKVRSTKRCRPWRLLYYEECETRAEAIQRELWFKSRSGRKKILEIIEGEKKKRR